MPKAARGVGCAAEGRMGGVVILACQREDLVGSCPGRTAGGGQPRRMGLVASSAVRERREGGLDRERELMFRITDCYGLKDPTHGFLYAHFFLSYNGHISKGSK